MLRHKCEELHDGNLIGKGGEKLVYGKKGDDGKVVYYSIELFDPKDNLEKQRGKGTTEDLYWWYKKQVKMGQTPSEMAISLGRKTTKGLQPNI